MTPAHVSRERRWRVAALVVARGRRRRHRRRRARDAGTRRCRAHPERAGRRARRGVVGLVLHRADDRGRRVAGLPRAHQHDGAARSPRTSPRRRTRGPPRTPPPPSRRTAWWRRPSRACRRARGSPRPSSRRAAAWRSPRRCTAPSGWSQAPCQSTTSAQWYFAGGSTAAANTLYVSLLNPTSTPVVVDLSFVTPAGMVHPINYQGIVLPAGPGGGGERDVGGAADRRTISTVVTAADRPRRRVRGAGDRRGGRAPRAACRSCPACRRRSRTGRSRRRRRCRADRRDRRLQPGARRPRR